MASGLETALLRMAGTAVADKEDLLDITDTVTAAAGYRKELTMSEEVNQDTIQEDHLEEEIDGNRGRMVNLRVILVHLDIFNIPQRALDTHYHLDLTSHFPRSYHQGSEIASRETAEATATAIEIEGITIGDHRVRAVVGTWTRTSLLTGVRAGGVQETTGEVKVDGAKEGMIDTARRGGQLLMNEEVAEKSSEIGMRRERSGGRIGGRLGVEALTAIGIEIAREEIGIGNFTGDEEVGIGVAGLRYGQAFELFSMGRVCTMNTYGWIKITR